MDYPGSSVYLSKLEAVVKSIGSPFNSKEFSQLERYDLMQLYDIAKKNKVGLLFLESIPSCYLVGELEVEARKQRSQYMLIKETLKRVSNVLQKSGLEYAIIKSKYPFQVVPNDIDVLLFGNNKKYQYAIEQMMESSFELLGQAPLESCFHDATRGKHKDPKKKDPMDVDIYSEVGAGHIVYMDKKKLEKNLVQVFAEGQPISVLSQPAELALSIFHSIFPERVFTLLLYYQILNCVGNFNIDEFLQVCKEHRFMGAARLVLSITEIVHDLIFGSVPAILSNLRQSFGDRLNLNIEKIPYNYSTKLILNCFWKKGSDRKFSSTLVKQAISMLNIKYARYVFSVYEDRRKRETY